MTRDLISKHLYFAHAHPGCVEKFWGGNSQNGQKWGSPTLLERALDIVQISTWTIVTSRV